MSSEPDDNVHYYWVNADQAHTGRQGFYAVGPMPSMGVVVVSGPNEYHYRTVDEFDSFYGSWRELVPIRCMFCLSHCTGNPPVGAYEFWFCKQQCDLQFAYRTLVWL